MSIKAATGHEVKGYCLHKPGAWQDEPWEGDVVAKVGSKIFAFLGRTPSASSVGRAAPRPTSGSRSSRTR